MKNKNIIFNEWVFNRMCYLNMILWLVDPQKTFK